MDEPDAPRPDGDPGERTRPARGRGEGALAPDSPDSPDSAAEGRLAWLARRRRHGSDEGRRRHGSDEGLAERFAGQWSQQVSMLQARAAHRDQLPEIRAVVPSGVSNFSRAEVPYGVDLAAAWAWRFVIIVAAGWLIVQGLASLTVVVLPLVIALFLASLAVPAVQLLARALPRGLAALLVVLALVGVVGLMLTFATQQVVDGFSDLADQVVAGIDRIQVWLREGPLGISDQQVNDLLRQLQQLVTQSNEQIVARVTEVGSAVGNIIAGFFIVLFATYFFLADGERIWTWVVRLFPRAARSRADSSGRVAWLSMTQFVRATVMVAAVDAIGIAIVAAVLNLPFVMAIALLVFLGSFVPIVGATVTGLVAVLVALVAQGPLVALFMLLGVIGVQQIEGQILQPFLLGRMVSVHPLAVILAVASGVLVAGVIGALIAVPLVATVNAVAVHLAGERERAVTDDSVVHTGEEEEHDPTGDAS